MRPALYQSCSAARGEVGTGTVTSCSLAAAALRARSLTTTGAADVSVRDFSRTLALLWTR